jgi:hypothetical protein
MKKTNHQPGPRGINLKGGATHWVEPGQTVEIETKKVDGKDKSFIDGIEVQGELPDFGRKADAQADAAADVQIEALTAERDALKAQVASLQSDLDKATKPAK